jgi:CDP-diacylglycerol--glycerol-3-phosphate 3-phosphatidyltransferase
MEPIQSPDEPPSLSLSANSDLVETEGVYQHKYFTIPNIICSIRLIGAFWLFWIAIQSRLVLFTSIFVVLNLSDWIDGRLARWLKQRSDFGARLDSFADSVLYGALFFGLFHFRGEVLLREAGWWMIGLLSYLLTTGAGLWKYGRVPSYHTYGAKVSQWFVLAGAICLLLDYTVWPFRISMFLVTLTNLEATAITWTLTKWRADVLSIFHVMPRNDRSNSATNSL